MDASTQLQLKQCFRFQGFSSQKRSSNFECKHPLVTANGSVLSATRLSALCRGKPQAGAQKAHPAPFGRRGFFLKSIELVKFAKQAKSVK